MEAAPLSSSLGFSSPRCPPSFHSSPFAPAALPFQPLIHASPLPQVHALCLKSPQRKQLHHLITRHGRRGLSVRSSASETPSIDDSTKWLFEPIVSGVHARLEKKGGALLITDLDSTNGTFINDMKLRPGAVTTVLPGCFITFGDTNLAIFRVSKIVVEENESAGMTVESEIRVEADGQKTNLEA